ncbi:MAG: aldehyde dehydrogenase [Sphingomonadaceae bacterium]|nr:aldehyde dehydrogenase [Sphingomonadaceae bacterium]
MNADKVASALQSLEGVAGRVLIGNEWLGTGAVLSSISPSDGSEISGIALAGQSEIDAAVDAAQSAMAGEWGKLLPAARARLMLKLAELIEAHVDVIATIEAADGVRPYVEALYGDIPASAGIFRHYAGVAGTIEGSIKYPSIGYAPPGTELRCLVDRSPIGVVASIIPWNFPFVMACVRVAPALAAGCSVILKPPEDASLSSLLLGKLAVEAGFPAGAINILTGRGDEAGAALVRHDGVDKISFTGSTRVGRDIGAVAGATFKKHSLELGGKCSAIVMDDADLDWAAAGLAGSSFGNAGQVCVASARILVHEVVHDMFIEKLKGHAGAKRPGSTFDAEASLGPIISAKQQQRIFDLVDDAKTTGATLSNDAVTETRDGFYANPVIVSDLPQNARMAQEEVFGPVVAVESFTDLDAAIASANATPYGLAGSVWTQRWRDANHVMKHMEAGMIYVNCHAWADPSIPMEGLKASGIGVEGGREGVEGYLKSKTALALL